MVDFVARRADRGERIAGFRHGRSGRSGLGKRALQGLGLVVVLGALAVACGGSQKLTDAANTSDTSTPAAPGKNESNQASGVAVAAPLNVPAIGGNDVESVVADAERRFKEECGGTVCVKLVVVPIAHPSPPGCESFTGDTSPPKGSSIQRGSVVKLPFDVSGCDSANSETTPSTKAPTQSPSTTAGAKTSSSPTTSP